MPIDLNSAFSLFLFAFSMMTLLQLGSQFAGPFTVTYSEEALYVADRSQSPFVPQNR